MNPLVSVIVTCYNQAKYINDTINSILIQSYSNYEIILVDDGSTDLATINLLDNLPWGEVKLFRIPNSGVSQARNHGIKNSSGKYIVILDGDDMLITDFLSKTIPVLENNDSVKIVRTNVKSFGTKSGFYRYPTYSLPRLLMQNLMVVTSVFRRVDFDKTNGFSNTMNEGLEDWNFWIDLLKDGGDVHNVDEVLFLYRQHKLSKNNSRNYHQEMVLYKQIYINHKDIYDKLLTNSEWILEYQQVINSKEYKLACLLMDFSKLIAMIKSKLF